MDDNEPDMDEPHELREINGKWAAIHNMRVCVFAAEEVKEEVLESQIIDDDSVQLKLNELLLLAREIEAQLIVIGYKEVK